MSASHEFAIFRKSPAIVSSWPFTDADSTDQACAPIIRPISVAREPVQVNRSVFSILWIAALWIATTIAARAGEAVRWAPDLPAAQAAAQRFQVPLMIHFYGDHCLPCELVDARVFTDPEVISTLNRYFICARVNASAAENRPLAAQYQVHSWPTDVFISPDGKTLYQGVSPTTANTYLAILKNVAVLNRDRNVMLAAQQQANPATPPPASAEAPGYQASEAPGVTSKALYAQSNPSANPAPNGASIPTAPSASAIPNQPAGRGATLTAADHATTVAGPLPPHLQAPRLSPSPPASPHLQTPSMSATNPHASLPPAGPGPSSDPGMSRPSPATQLAQQQGALPQPSIRPATGSSDGSPSSNTHRATPPMQLASRPSDNPRFQSATITSHRNATEAPARTTPPRGAADVSPQEGQEGSEFYQFASRQTTHINREATSGSTTQDRWVPGTGDAARSTGGILISNPYAADTPSEDSTPSMAAPATDTASGRPAQSSANGGFRQMAEVDRASTDHPSLGGFCPVTLAQAGQWAEGKRQFAVRHRGKVYFLASRELMETFLAEPDAYSPVLGGYDPLVYLEEGKLVEGKLEFGLHDQDTGRLYLFSSAQSKQRYWQEFDRYQRELQQILEPLGLAY
ncbi:MAG: DUF255 domain-containing protein [Planctomycetota bacterium]|nr:MAG: DUF255 domain-containing protein [Planctomycetota bacterium]